MKQFILETYVCLNGVIDTEKLIRFVQYLSVLYTALLKYVQELRKDLSLCLCAVLIIWMSLDIVGAFDIFVRHDSVACFIHLLESLFNN